MDRAVCCWHCLQEVGPYMLRREKKEVFQSQDDAAAGAAGGAASAASSPQSSDGAAAQAKAAGGASKAAAMPHKNDLIVWLKLKPMQKKVYQAFLNSGKWVGGLAGWVGNEGGCQLGTSRHIHKDKGSHLALAHLA